MLEKGRAAIRRWLVLLVAAVLVGAAAAQGQDMMDELFGGTAEPEPAAAVQIPVSIPIRPGRLVSVTITQNAVACLDLKELLLQGKLRPTEPAGSLQAMRRPEQGNVFLVLDVDLAKGLSIGKYDYRVNVAGTVYDCIALTRGQDVFDPREWEMQYEGSGKPVRLLYEVRLPENAATMLLMPALELTLEGEVLTVPLVPAGSDAATEQEAAPAAAN
jgi:hypothetical protein